MKFVDNDATNWKILEYLLWKEYTKYFIQHFPEIEHMEWISVKDELPKETYIPVICASRSSLVLVKCEDRIVFAYTQDSRWYNFCSESDEDDEIKNSVTHWMPLPEMIKRWEDSK